MAEQPTIEEPNVEPQPEGTEVKAEPETEALLKELEKAGVSTTQELQGKLKASRETGKLAEVKFGTFDLSPTVLAAVRDGEMLFAIDQHQYLQGYLAVVMMVKYIDTRALPGAGSVIPTGPGLVTAETAADVISMSERGVR